eukprot:COSAG04_NODE_1094_length_8313_cov_18.592160_10_plen_61_part_00
MATCGGLPPCSVTPIESRPAQLLASSRASEAPKSLCSLLGPLAQQAPRALLIDVATLDAP